MKKKLLVACATLISNLFSYHAQAEWFQTTARVQINSTKAEARLRAFDEALLQAITFAGADISSMNRLRPYLKDRRPNYNFNDHEVRSIHVINDAVSKNKNDYLVTAQFDIYPSANSCHNTQYRKTLLFGKFNIAAPKQASLGQIYNVGDHFSDILKRQFSRETGNFVPVGKTSYGISSNAPNVLKMISDDTGAQYVINGEISDLSATVDSKGVIYRQFALETHIYDGKTGQELTSNTYRKSSVWPFARNAITDTKGAQFWNSSYGQVVIETARNVMLDAEQSLTCRLSLPTVVAVNDVKVTIDLGRIHGVHVGDKLQLWHTASFVDQQGLARSKVIRTDITLTVDRVHETNAELSVDQANLAQSIQIGDVMHKL